VEIFDPWSNIEPETELCSNLSINNLKFDLEEGGGGRLSGSPLGLLMAVEPLAWLMTPLEEVKLLTSVKVDEDVADG